MTLQAILLRVIKRGMTGGNFISGRDDFLPSHEYFMAMAILTSKCSPDPRTQVGACLVTGSRILGLGYNRFPDGCEKEFPWGKSKNLLESKHGYVVHAEVNAILNAPFDQLRGSSMYVTRHPCHECAKLITQSGINNITYLSDPMDESTMVAKRMFAAAKVSLKKFDGCTDTIQIEFNRYYSNNCSEIM